MSTLPAEIRQNSRSDVSGHNLSETAARYFDYESAVALRNLAAAYGTAMPRYLLAPEVAVLLAAVPDLKKRLFIDTLWNTGGRLNEILPLTSEDFVLDDPLTGAPLDIRSNIQRQHSYGCAHQYVLAVIQGASEKGD